MKHEVVLLPGSDPEEEEQEKDNKDDARIVYTCLAPCTSFLACGANNGYVHIYNCSKVEDALRLSRWFVPSPTSGMIPGQASPVTALAVSYATGYLAVGTEDGAVSVLRAGLHSPEAYLCQRDATKVWLRHAVHEGPITALAWDPHGTGLFSGCATGRVLLAVVEGGNSQGGWTLGGGAAPRLKTYILRGSGPPVRDIDVAPPRSSGRSAGDALMAVCLVITSVRVDLIYLKLPSGRGSSTNPLQQLGALAVHPPPLMASAEGMLGIDPGGCLWPGKRALIAWGDGGLWWIDLWMRAGVAPMELPLEPQLPMRVATLPTVPVSKSAHVDSAERPPCIVCWRPGQDWVRIVSVVTGESMAMSAGASGMPAGARAGVLHVAVVPGAKGNGEAYVLHEGGAVSRIALEPGEGEDRAGEGALSPLPVPDSLTEIADADDIIRQTRSLLSPSSRGAVESRSSTDGDEELRRRVEANDSELAAAVSKAEKKYRDAVAASPARATANPMQGLLENWSRTVHAVGQALQPGMGGDSSDEEEYALSPLAPPMALSSARLFPVPFAAAVPRFVRRRSANRGTLPVPVAAEEVKVADLPESSVDDPTPFVPPSQYLLRLDASKGLGISLSIVGTKVKVTGFAPVDDRGPGPAETSGQVSVGDVLLGLNGRELGLLRFGEIVDALRSLLRVREGEIELRFAYAEESLVPVPQEDSPSKDREKELRRCSSMPSQAVNAAGLVPMPSPPAPLLSPLPAAAEERDREAYPLSATSASTSTSAGMKRYVPNFIAFDTPHVVAHLRLAEIASDVRAAHRIENAARISRFFEGSGRSVLIYPRTSPPRPLVKSSPPPAKRLKRRIMTKEPQVRDPVQTYDVLAKEELQRLDRDLQGKALLLRQREHSEPASDSLAVHVASALLSRRRRSGSSELLSEGLPYWQAELDPMTLTAATSAPAAISPSLLPSADVEFEAVPTADVVQELGEALGVRKVIEQRKGSSAEELEAGALYDSEVALEALLRVAQETVGVQVDKELEGAKGLQHEPLGLGLEKLLRGERSKWPPVRLTLSMGAVLVLQQQQAFVPEAVEPLLQVWLRTFTPASPKHRHHMWADIRRTPASHAEALTQQHHRLTCDLVTLYFQLHVAWAFLGLPTWCSLQARDSSRHQLLAMSLTWGPLSDPSLPSFGLRGMTQWGEEEAESFLETYGSYMELNSAAAAAGALEMSSVMSRCCAFFRADASLSSAEHELDRLLVASSGAASFSPSAISSVSSSISKHGFCLLLRVLPRLFAWNPAAAAGFCACHRPHLRPWIVYRALYEHPSPAWCADSRTAAAIDAAVRDSGGSPKMWSDLCFYAYLWALLVEDVGGGRGGGSRLDAKVVHSCLSLGAACAAALRNLPLSDPTVKFCATITLTDTSRAVAAEETGAGPLFLVLCGRIEQLAGEWASGKREYSLDPAWLLRMLQQNCLWTSLVRVSLLLTRCRQGLPGTSASVPSARLLEAVQNAGKAAVAAKDEALLSDAIAVMASVLSEAVTSASAHHPRIIPVEVVSHISSWLCTPLVLNQGGELIARVCLKALGPAVTLDIFKSNSKLTNCLTSSSLSDIAREWCRCDCQDQQLPCIRAHFSSLPSSISFPEMLPGKGRRRTWRARQPLQCSGARGKWLHWDQPWSGSHARK
jgi:hypothetical protein